MSTCNTCQW